MLECKALGLEGLCAKVLGASQLLWLIERNSIRIPIQYFFKGTVPGVE